MIVTIIEYCEYDEGTKMIVTPIDFGCRSYPEIAAGICTHLKSTDPGLLAAANGLLNFWSEGAASSPPLLVKLNDARFLQFSDGLDYRSATARTVTRTEYEFTDVHPNVPNDRPGPKKKKP